LKPLTGFGRISWDLLAPKLRSIEEMYGEIDKKKDKQAEEKKKKKSKKR